ncbi:MAG: GxxExxY protein [Chitinophagales bacterium]
MSKFIYGNESYNIIGACMEVHSILGKGHKEIVYGDALKEEFNLRSIPFSRELKYQLTYKKVVLPHHYFADFVVYDKIILEIKAIESISNAHIKQTLNYLAASKLKLGLLINFGEDSLEYKRVIL